MTVFTEKEGGRKLILTVETAPSFIKGPLCWVLQLASNYNSPS